MHRIFHPIIAFLALSLGIVGYGAFAQSPGSGPNVHGAGTYGPAYSNANGHWLYGSGAAPTISSCGTSPSAVVGTDVAFQFSSGSTASGVCTVTPSIAYAKTPICIVGTTNATKPSYSISSGGIITMGAVQDSTSYSVVCYAQPGGL